MSEQTKDGGPAFPHDDRVKAWERAGMTLRDYFAAKAMQGFLSRYDDFEDLDQIVSEAFLVADKMVAAREKQS
jgi:hypothetical protein